MTVSTLWLRLLRSFILVSATARLPAPTLITSRTSSVQLTGNCTRMMHVAGLRCQTAGRPKSSAQPPPFEIIQAVSPPGHSTVFQKPEHCTGTHHNFPSTTDQPLDLRNQDDVFLLPFRQAVGPGDGAITQRRRTWMASGTLRPERSVERMSSRFWVRLVSSRSLSCSL